MEKQHQFRTSVKPSKKTYVKHKTSHNENETDPLYILVLPLHASSIMTTERIEVAMTVLLYVCEVDSCSKHYLAHKHHI
jgi:hypothetical protein